ncbi:S41 family peptidase [Vicingaceae bacterium]|nr:S41 family peptidase [Vicingaceae bacterium]MDB4060855.1 S41 family peptidase [Vicingaceae bacterium]
MKKTKKIIVATSISISAFLSYGFADNYFELSKNLDIFSTLLKELNTYYVDETKPGELMKTGIDAMLESLDPYTNYIPESAIEDYRFMTTGQYGGIGALIHKDSNEIIISEPYEGFPAFKSGLKAGDVILKVNENEVEGKNSDDISKLLRGQSGSSLNVTIKRPNVAEPMVKEIVRETIKINDVPYFKMLDNEVGYIKLSSFTQTASKEFIAAFNELKDKGMKELVFDLRGNGGGLLIEAVDIVNIFIAKGQKVVETRGKLKKWDATYLTRKEPLDTKIPIAILVDAGSASASEIVSGTLQDYDRAVIIGRQTFGKGLVQQTRPLSYNAQLKVTVAKYYIPSGRCIQRIDYSSKDGLGKAQTVPDSLINSFKTVLNKRPVKDGKGIKPDLFTEEESMSIITATLMRSYNIFNYATLYYLNHPKIAPAKEFQLSDKEYNEFIAFLADKEYNYSTQSEEVLKKLKEVAKDEKYFASAEIEYGALLEKLTPKIESDLIKFKSEIKMVLENEIISRYYFQDGRIEQSLNSDPDVKEALQLLKNKKQYNEILAGTFVPNK